MDSDCTELPLSGDSASDDQKNLLTERVSDVGREAAASEEYHAMVLLGMRTDGDKKFFLFQNWWPEMQLVELSDEYLMNADGELRFVAAQNLKEAQPKHWHEVNSARVTESLLDRADGPPKPSGVRER